MRGSGLADETDLDLHTNSLIYRFTDLLICRFADLLICNDERIQRTNYRIHLQLERL